MQHQKKVQDLQAVRLLATVLLTCLTVMQMYAPIMHVEGTVYVTQSRNSQTFPYWGDLGVGMLPDSS